MKPRIDRRKFLVASSATAGLAAVGVSPIRANTARLRIAGLKVDFLDRPLGLENGRPRLSWQLQSDERNTRQSTYRIRVASSESALVAGTADLWDSGKIASDQCCGVEYDGAALASRQQCWWSVQVWNERGDSAASAPSWWEMGLLEAKDWQAHWLAVETQAGKTGREAGFNWIWGEPKLGAGVRKFRFKFHLPVASKGGELFAAANDWIMWTQISRIWIDDAPVAGSGEWVYAGGFAERSTQEFALPRLKPGEHLIAIEVRTGDIDPSLLETSIPLLYALALSARLELEDDRMLRVISSPQWKTSLTEEKDWHSRTYDDSSWEAARPVAELKNYQPVRPQPAMHLRREFAIAQPVVAARLYATALGGYEAWINGRRVGDALLTPEPSQYAKRVLYRVYDITALVHAGENALGLTVGDGWYASFDGYFAYASPPRRALAQLELTLADGSRRIIATGPGWRIAESPIRRSEIKGGEIYDARFEQPGWNSARFDDAHWRDAEIAATPECRVVAQVSPPVRITETLRPRAISQPRPGVHLVDFGTNLAGWCRLRVKGQAGARIELAFAERLTPAGEIDTRYGSMGFGKQDIFILKGDPSGETFEPHFTYRGFRYVQITGVDTAPTADSIEGRFIHSDLQLTGQLSSSAPLIEQLWRNVLQSQRSNFVGIPTDNPTREQRGWMNDAAGCFWDTAAFNMDVCAFTARFMDEVVDGQTGEGAFPMLAPLPRYNNAFYHIAGSPPGWGDAGIILPWTVWRRYGDLAIAERNWEAMNRHLKFIGNRNPDYLWKNQRSTDFGDWMEGSGFNESHGIPTTPGDLLGTAYWAHSADLLAQMAAALGRAGEASRLRALFGRIRHAFNQSYVKADGTVGSDSQSGYVLALQFGLLPEATHAAAAGRLALEIRRRGPALTTGTVATQFVLDVLAEAGYGTLAYDLLLRTEYPSWGYMIRQGATAMWETWSGDQEPVGASQNQMAFGAVCGFLMRRLTGIDAASPGFKTIRIRPLLDPRVRRGGGHYDSIMGRISTDWRQTSGGGFQIDLTLPDNTRAQIHLPARSNGRILEGRTEISRRPDVRVQRLDREAVVEVGSGSYRFAVES